MEPKGYVVDLGLMAYGEAWDLQHRLWSMRVEGRLPDLLLLLEHPHVITLGRRGDLAHLLVSPEVLEALGIPVFHTDRGGDVTYHGPGQLVAYPIFGLRHYGYRLHPYVSQLEEVVLAVLRDFGIDGKRDPSHRGVWVGGEKIASVGVAIKRWVSLHGLALNYETDLKYFNLIHPCGLEGQGMTSMAKILKESVSRQRLVERFSFRFKEAFPKEWEEKGPDELLGTPEGRETLSLPPTLGRPWTRRESS
ncbi:MAG: lipoyl(octanoyl) transferase LipB [Desulfobacterota bacterium]|nr:lipoyl(octanoyl) transferase LipB [Thermodesulfobacteriota bacterium]